MFRKASEVRTDDYQSTLLLAQALRILGKEEARETFIEGINRAKKQYRLNPTDRRLLSFTSGSLYEIGEKEEAFKWINKAMELYPEDISVLVNGAGLFAKAHDHAKALSLLEKVVNKGYGKRDWIENDSDYDSLRNDPTFKVLLDKMQGS